MRLNEKIMVSGEKISHKGTETQRKNSLCSHFLREPSKRLCGSERLSAVLFCSILLTFFLLGPARAEQPCKIISVKDTNLFLTKDSLLISLANVETPSLHDPDSLRRKMAQRYFIKIEKLLLSNSFMMETASRDHDTAQVHLFKRLSVGGQSINKFFLREGWGVFNPNPASEYSKDYEREAQASAWNGRGTDSDSATAKAGAKGALWFSAGLGASTDNALLLFGTTDWAVHLRFKRLLLTAGRIRHSHEKQFYQLVYYGAGLATVEQRSETAVVMGLTQTDPAWEWAMDSSFFIKVNRIYHLKQGLGLGAEMIMHLGEKQIYATAALQVIFGGWRH